MIRLFYKGAGSASVHRTVTGQSTVSDKFNSIDAACDFLIDTLKVNEDCVDDALVQLYTNRHTVAVFTSAGTLQSTGFY